jgi:hypothetical protein
MSYDSLKFCIDRGNPNDRFDRSQTKGGKVMKTYTYMSLTPESLVVSMLDPGHFGTYLATGTKKRSTEEAFYFELDASKLPDEFGLGVISERCVPHADGTPKHSVYASIYRVLERVPLDAVGSLWLTTPDGRVLELTAAPQPPEDFSDKYFLYQELAPVHPLIASSLNPVEFATFITDCKQPVCVPKICFATLDLAGLATDPANGSAAALPYKNIAHLRDCLAALGEQDKRSKTVDRLHTQHVHFRCIKGGFYIGGSDGLKYYPFPSQRELDEKHHNWWRSADLC